MSRPNLVLRLPGRTQHHSMEWNMTLDPLFIAADLTHIEFW